MIYKATQELTNSLLNLPESGKGYQIITAFNKGSYMVLLPLHGRII